MITASVLGKEKIISLSELQKNPSKALAADIVRIVKNGKEIGIFMSKEEFEDLIEDQLPLKASFKKELKKSRREAKNKNLTSLKKLLAKV